MSDPRSIGNLLQDFIATELAGTSRLYQDKMGSLVKLFIIYLNRRQLTPKIVADYAPYLLDGRCTRVMLPVHLQHLRRFLTWMWRMGYSSTRWHEHVPRIASCAPLQEPVIIGQEEYERLRKMASYNQDWEWLIVLGHSTGLRLGDCCNLCWSQIDQDQQYIKVCPHKTRNRTGRVACIPYTTDSDLYQFIAGLWQEKESAMEVHKDYVCPAMALHYNSNSAHVTRAMTAIFHKAGIIGKTFKGFRSTFESRIANSGMNMGMAARITGRSDTKTLLRYIRPDMEAAREGVAKALDLHTKLEGFR